MTFLQHPHNFSSLKNGLTLVFYQFIILANSEIFLRLTDSIFAHAEPLVPHSGCGLFTMGLAHSTDLFFSFFVPTLPQTIHVPLVIFSANDLLPACVVNSWGPGSCPEFRIMYIGFYFIFLMGWAKEESNLVHVLTSSPAGQALRADPKREFRVQNIYQDQIPKGKEEGVELGRS